MNRRLFIFISGLALSIVLGGRVGAADNLLATDKEIKMSVPAPSTPLPVHLVSSLSTQYAPEPSPDPAGGMLRLGKMALEEGVSYPVLAGEIYSGNSVGEKLMPSAKDGFPMASPNSTYLTSWLNKQWATVNLSLAHTHLIEKPEDQMVVGASKGVSVLRNALFLSVGEYLFSDLNTRYWSRTTDLAVDYGWKNWAFSMLVQQREDPSLREHTIWAAINKKF